MLIKDNWTKSIIENHSLRLRKSKEKRPDFQSGRIIILSVSGISRNKMSQRGWIRCFLFRTRIRAN